MHGGYVTIDSTVGVGTTVSIFLPLLPDSQLASAPRREPAGA
jgi:signal transduction histidine kinase